MSTNAISANVIPMRDFEREPPSQQAVQFDRLLKECRDMALARLSAALGAMFDRLPDLNPPSASSVQDRETRDLFVRAKLCAIEQRATMQDQFQAHFLAEFDAASRGRKPSSDFGRNDLSSLELSLVDEADFEETLRVNEMGAKLRRYCDEEVVALDQRMGVLIGDATLQDQANPLSPQTICNAYRQACRKIEPDGKVRLLLLKLFDDHVLDEIRPLYKDLNGLLVERSILPKIRYSTARRASALGALPGIRPEAAEAAAQLLDAAQPAAAARGEQDFFALLQNLMGGARRTAPQPGAAPAALGSFPAILAADSHIQLPAADLVRSLTRIQHGDVSGIGGADVPMAATLIDPGVTNVLRQLKSTSFASNMGQTEGTTLEIVIMLFDQIFDDSKIPSAMKGLIGRLQIPMLKVAILDKSFFSNKQHPARRFLDAMGELCLTVPEDFGSSSPLYAELDRIVQKLIDSFQEKLDVFDELRAELDRIGAQQTQQVQESSRHLAAAVEQRERLGIGKAVAQHAIKLRVESKKVPAVVVRFLAEQWVKLLIVAYAKHGADSEAYKAATSTIDLLVWSVTPMQSLDERRKLATRLPGLLKRLDYGLQLTGTPEEVRKRFFAKLMRCHTKVMNANTSSAPSAHAQPAAASAQSTTMPGADVHEATNACPERQSPEAATPMQVEQPTEPALPQAAAPAASAPDSRTTAAGDAHDDTEPQEGAATFAAVTIPNPFGDGQIEVEEIDLAELPAGSLPDLPAAPGSSASTGDEHSQMVSRLQEGAWVEFRDDGQAKPARLSYISPLKGTYLFVNRQGRKVGEYSLYQLAREFRSGKAVPIDSAPLFDRAMTNLVGALKATA